ncbi:MAG: beta-lactamase family protein [Actinomycetota bacterium]|nr:beta-lactamase family protein [Actinomycetota bacterium]
MSALAAIDTWPVVRVAAAVMAPDAVADTRGPVDEVFSWASLTKLLTAVATLVAVEEGTVALDSPAGPPRSTVRHLLAHASGLAPDDDRALAPPGRRRIYSNRGFELLSESVARAAGMPFADYAAAAVLEPLGMTDTSWGGSAASGTRGPLHDLTRLAMELLHPTLVDVTTLAAATRCAFPGLSGVLPGFGHHSPNDWGLGFELRDGKAPHWTGTANSPRTFGHFGRAGGFLWVDPDARLACASLSDRDFDRWAGAAWPALSDAVLAEHHRP